MENNNIFFHNNRIELVGLSKEEINDELRKLNLQRFRLTQIWSWIYRFGISNFHEMDNISKNLRKDLEKIFKVGRLNVS